MVCRQTREALRLLYASLSRKIVKLGRQELRAFTAALTGHGPFNEHLCNLSLA